MRRIAPCLAVALMVAFAGLPVAHAQDAPAEEPEIEITEDEPPPADSKPAPAKPDKETKKKEKERSKLVKAGDGLFKKGDYAGALAKYQQAYDVLPSPLLYYPMAKAEEQLQRPIEAISHYEQFLVEGAGIINEDLKVDAEVSIQELEKTIAVVKLDIRPDGATVSLDDVELGQSPIEKPVRLMPGPHKLTATHAGRKPVERTLDLSAGDNIVEKAILEEDRPNVVIKEEPKEDPVVSVGPRRRGKTMLYVGIGTTVACGLGWAITGSLALSAHDTFVDPMQPGGDRGLARDNGKTLALTSDLLLVGAVVSGGFTAWWYYSVYSKEPGAESERIDPRGAPPVPGGDDEEDLPPGLDDEAMVLPYAGPDGAGVAVTGTF